MKLGILTEKENAAIWDFHCAHDCLPAAHRVLQITVTPTAIAPHIEAKCIACGEVSDVTDYDSW